VEVIWDIDREATYRESTLDFNGKQPTGISHEIQTGNQLQGFNIGF